MSRDPRHGERSPADPSCGGLRRVAELIERRLADARAHAERGRLADANARVLELRSGLVGRRPGDGAGLLRHSRDSAASRTSVSEPDRVDRSYRPDGTGRIAGSEPRSGITRLGWRTEWLKAVQLAAQAIADLATASATSNLPSWPEVRSAALAVWESRHRDRFTRWARGALAECHPVESSRAEGSP
jgi:hypothetical protein